MKYKARNIISQVRFLLVLALLLLVREAAIAVSVQSLVRTHLRLLNRNTIAAHSKLKTGSGTDVVASTNIGTGAQ